MKVTALGRELHQQLFDVENKRMVRRFRLRVLHQGLGQGPKQVWIVVWEPSGACCDVLTNCTALQMLARSQMQSCRTRSPFSASCRRGEAHTEH